MADIASSLIHAFAASPAEVQRAPRSPNLRQVAEPQEFAAGSSTDGVQESKRSHGKDAARSETENEVQGEVEKTAAQRSGVQDGRRDFRMLLEKRLAAPQASAKGTKQEPQEGYAQPGLVIAGGMEVVVNKPLAPSGREKALRGERPGAAIMEIRQTPSPADAKESSKAGTNPVVEKEVGAGASRGEVRPLNDKEAVARMLPQNQRPAPETAADKNIQNAPDEVENAEKSRESRIGIERYFRAEQGKEGQAIALRGSKFTSAGDQTSASAGDWVRTARIGDEAAIGRAAEPGPTLAGMKTGPGADGMQNKEPSIAEQEAPRLTAGKETVSASAAEPSGQVAEVLRSLQSAAGTDAPEQPAPVAAGSVRPGPLIMSGESPAEQIIQSIRLDTRGQQHEVDIRLHPVELGAVRMKLHHADGEVRGILFVEKAQTRYEIEKELPQIIASLQHNGVQVRRLEVVMNQQQHHQNESQGGAHGNAFAETDQGRFDNQARGNGNESDLKNSEHQSADTTAAQAHEERITDEAINVYV